MVSGKSKNVSYIYHLPLFYSFEREESVDKFDMDARDIVLTEALSAHDGNYRGIILFALDAHKRADFDRQRREDRRAAQLIFSVTLVRLQNISFFITLSIRTLQESVSKCRRVPSADDFRRFANRIDDAPQRPLHDAFSHNFA